MGEMALLSEDASHGDIVKALHQNHQCLEDHKLASAAGFARLEKQIGAIAATQGKVATRLEHDQTATEKRFDNLEVNQATLIKALGAEGGRKTLAGVSVWKALAAFAASVPGAFLAWKALTAAWPFLTAAMAAATGAATGS